MRSIVRNQQLFFPIHVTVNRYQHNLIVLELPAQAWLLEVCKVRDVQVQETDFIRAESLKRSQTMGVESNRRSAQYNDEVRRGH